VTWEVEHDPPVLVEVVRCGVVESSHRGHVAVLDGAGLLTHHLGAVTVPRFGRSVLKPVQAAALVAAGLDPPDPLLALVAGSHSGAPFHIDAVRTILADAGLDESALGNAPALPMGTDEAADYLRAGHKPAAVVAGCSGKHAGMLATCVANGWRQSGYLEPDHPVQRAIRERLTRLSGEQSRIVGVDGCGAPTFAVSLTGVARAFRHLALAPSGSPERRVADALRAHPEFASGAGRADTRLASAVPGLVVKDGAEGFCAAALPDGRAVAVKVDDGALRAVEPLMVLALRLAGLDPRVLPEPAYSPVLGGEVPVGAVVRKEVQPGVSRPS
jgi:L-asparaginase II